MRPLVVKEHELYQLLNKVSQYCITHPTMIHPPLASMSMQLGEEVLGPSSSFVSVIAFQKQQHFMNSRSITQLPKTYIQAQSKIVGNKLTPVASPSPYSEFQSFLPLFVM